MQKTKTKIFELTTEESVRVAGGCFCGRPYHGTHNALLPANPADVFAIAQLAKAQYEAERAAGKKPLPLATATGNNWAWR